MIKGIKAIFEVVDRATAPIRRIGSAFRAINLAPLRDQLGRVMSAAKGVGVELGKMALAAGASIGAAVAGAGAILLRVADVAKEVKLGAERIGMTTKAFQGLGYAAERTGSNVEEFADAMKDFNEKIVEAASGDNKDLAAGFKKMGVSLKDARGQLRPTEQILMQVADAFKRVPDGAKKSAAAMQLMGDAGVKLIPLLNKGSGGIKEIMAEADRLGLVLGDDAVAGLGRFSAAMGKFHAIVTGIQNTIAVALLPIVEPMITRFAEWAVVNRELIAGKVAEWVAKIPGVVEQATAAVTAWMDALAPVTAAIGALVDIVGPMNAGIGLMAALIGGKLLLVLYPLIKAVTLLGTFLARLAIGPLIAMFGQLFTALRSGMGVVAAFNAVLAANPIGATIAAVAALAASAYLIYRNWDSVGPWFKALWAGIKRVFNGFTEWVAGIFTGDFTRAANGIREMMAGLKDYLSTFWTGVRVAFGAFLSWLDGTFGTNFRGVFESIKTAIGAVLDWLDTELVGRFKAAFQAVQDDVMPIIDAIKAAIDGIMEAWASLPSMNLTSAPAAMGGGVPNVSRAASPAEAAGASVGALAGAGQPSAPAVPQIFGQGGRVPAPGAAPAGPPQAVSVNGQVDINVSAEGRPSVRARFDDPRIQPNVAAGLSNAMP